MLQYAELESRRFGLKVMRGAFDAVDEKRLAAALFDERADVGIVRFPAEKQSELARLGRIGLPYLVADSLVYYKIALESHKPAALRNGDVTYVKLAPGHLKEMQQLVRDTFANYRNHYSANPFLTTEGLIEGYTEWAMSFAAGTPERSGWLLYRGDKCIAFCTCTFSGEEGEGILYGVAPSEAGSGIYSDMIRFTKARAIETGCKIFKVSTQVNNYAVQKVWAREGFHLYEALTTVHINALLTHSVTAPVERTVSFSEADIEAYGRVSGDRNPIHFDDNAAAACGFSGKIVHGLAFTGWLSRFYGMESPGPGTIILSQSFAFQAPIYPGKPYQLRLSFPRVDERSGARYAVAQARDAAGKLAVVAHATLMHRRR